ncbi:MAG: hypothetical protein COV44_03345 [Deltaproteobacteria bacterium CG11_big_fil_rev_8_21_14_0_20_45_16]|nr:MAG: hypothetical protein COV44_03345 [Deltaproteobacteria bacterium CG11_big_fil_rev_8_21_14_0_20_45_16]
MSLIIQREVKDLRGNVLVKANTDLVEWSNKAIISGEYLKKKTRFKDAVSFVEDCEQIFSRKPYDKVLKGWTSNFREWLGEMYAPSVVFEELRHIRGMDPYSYQHIITIAVVGCRLLEIWITSVPTIKRSFQALICHRLGKSRISQEVLLKKETLDEAEKRIIFEQPMVGFVLNAFYWADANHLCAKVALQHQEDRKGSGYPSGVKTNSLLLDILHMLDRFDALISERPFRYKKFSVREALDILKQDVDEGRMEEDVLKAFTDLIRNETLSDYKALKFGSIGRPS